MNVPHTILNISLNVAFAACFIGLFFFTYAKNIEKQIVVNNVEYLVNDLFANTVGLMPNPVKTVMGIGLKNITLPNMKAQDEAVNKNNSDLLKLASITLGSLLIITLVGCYYLSEHYQLNLSDAIYHNLILLVCIGITEFIFLILIAQNYISVDPNHIFLNLINMLK
jgi:hypothetical protein